MKRRVLIALVVVLALAATGSGAWGEGSGVCHVPGDYATIQAAVNAPECAKIIVAPGTHFGAVVTRAVEIRGEEGAIINDGPIWPVPFTRSGFAFLGGGAGSGTTISGFTFQGAPQSTYTDDGNLDFPIFSRGANNVTVKNNVLNDSLQGITNWHGSGWTITHNELDGLWVLGGGGIGIFIGSRFDIAANSNLVAFNQISAVVQPGPVGYSTPGIGLMSDARWSFPGGPVQSNRVIHNQASVIAYDGTTPVGIGIELTDIGGTGRVSGNKVGFNDVRGSTVGLAFNPVGVEADNTIGRNLGDNRGDSENHPSIFW